jgi:hypothetical protein
VGDNITFDALEQLLGNGCALVHNCINEGEEERAYYITDGTGAVLVSGPSVAETLEARRVMVLAERAAERKRAGYTVEFSTFADLALAGGESREHAYRRGYRDGYVIALQGIEDMLTAGASRQVAIARSYEHADGPLSEWMHGDDSREQWAPRVAAGKKA